MNSTSLLSKPYLIRTECGKEYDLFSARWLIIKDDALVAHTLYVTQDHAYLYSTCNVFRDCSSPETYRVIDRDTAKAIFALHLSEEDCREYFT